MEEQGLPLAKPNTSGNSMVWFLCGVSDGWKYCLLRQILAAGTTFKVFDFTL